MASDKSPVIAYSDDSNGDDLFITQEPSQKTSNKRNLHDEPIMDLDIENLLNSSTDSAVGSVEEIYAHDRSSPEPLVCNATGNIINILHQNLTHP